MRDKEASTSKRAIEMTKAGARHALFVINTASSRSNPPDKGGCLLRVAASVSFFLLAIIIASQTIPT